jgi:hypothetical protein
MNFTSWQYHIGSLEDIVEEMGEVLSDVEEEKKGATPTTSSSRVVSASA